MENQQNGVNVSPRNFINSLFQEYIRVCNLDEPDFRREFQVKLDEFFESAAHANAEEQSILLTIGDYNGCEGLKNIMVIDINTIAIPAVWADIRYDQSHHCLSYAKKLAIIIAKRSLPQCPTAIVDTGTSIQAYWFFSDDLEILEYSTDEVFDIVKACQGSIRILAELVGLQIREPYYDRDCRWVGDRLMLPGFINHHTVDKKKVELIEFNSDRRYAISEFQYLMHSRQKRSQIGNGLLERYSHLFEQSILDLFGEGTVASEYSCDTKQKGNLALE